ncbi:hypothetical protein EMCG_07130 [[Emmonsia] crescens]|uniref:Uncharacterized protein n=1 Tax=[Emmonsia] crescens TaxID=73230 RepID=A0A0G2IA91_9EURO|nr:hypothetical protein EMCG_07130 [Emmonsia crescens UAMH 3008]
MSLSRRITLFIFATAPGPRRTGASKGESDNKAAANVIDPRWPDRPNDLFTHVKLDEAYNIKNVSSFSAMTISWMNAKFHLCLTATPLYNALRDFRGYHPLLFPKNCDDQWSTTNFQKFGVDETVNRFNLQLNDPRSNLVLTDRAMKDFIGASLAENVSFDGHFSPQYPSMEGMTVIGDTIPPLEHWVIESKLTEGEKALYDKQTPPLHRGLLIRQRDTGNICWNIKKHRHVALITTW